MFSQAGNVENVKHSKNKVKSSNITTVKRSNKLCQALNLPKIINVNPRSAMNKLEKLKDFIEEESIDVAFVSESHEREDFKLENIENILPGFKVISNVYQRREKGGRPALIVNKEINKHANTHTLGSRDYKHKIGMKYLILNQLMKNLKYSKKCL